MKCLECGETMKVVRGNFKDDAIGLPYVTLENIEQRRCPKCGETEIVIPNPDKLHRALAHYVAVKAGSLLPVEIRYLRKWLGWSGADFAKHFEVNPETVSRWENGKKNMGPVAERLLRVFVMIKAPSKSYEVDELLASLENDQTPAKRIGLKLKNKNWELQLV